MEQYQAERRIGTLVASKYRLERLLGSGGMGAVYGATHEFTKREVAVKLIHDTLPQSDSLRKRFIREAQAPSAIGHPGIVDVLDGGIAEDGSLYVVLEMLHGHTMGEWASGVPLPELIDVMVQLLSALDAAHQAGFVHRDIKPENIFLVDTNDGGWQVKLLDFGVAGLRELADGDTKLTKTGTVLGTPLFMSPEQAKGGVVDHRSDLWAVGAVLYEALAGQPPYIGETYNALIISIVTREHIPLSRLRPDLPRALLEVIELALRKDVGERWQTAADMANALRTVARQCEGFDSAPPAQHARMAETAAAMPRSRRAPDPVAARNGPPTKRDTVTGADTLAAPESGVESMAMRGATRSRATTTAAGRNAASEDRTPRAGEPPPAATSRASAHREPSSHAGWPWLAGAASAMLITGAAVAWSASDRTAARTGSAADEQIEAQHQPALEQASAPPAPADSPPPGDSQRPPRPAEQPTGDIEEAKTSSLQLTTPEPTEAKSSPLGSADLSQALSDVQDDLQRCYQDFVNSAVAAGNAVPEKATFDVVIHVSEQGRVEHTDIGGTGQPEVARCLQRKLDGLRFRATGRSATLRFPAVFEPEVIGR